MAVAIHSTNNQHHLKSYILFVCIGLATGIITRLTDFFPYNNLWSLSSIATLYGFWMVTVTLVIYFSVSNINAAINVFVYLMGMNVSFYLLIYILGFFTPRFYEEEFQWNLFILYSIFALVCSAISYVLYYWNKENRISSFLYALPVSGLVAETLAVGIYLYNHHTFLFQLIFDLISLILIGSWFYQKANNKLMYIATIGAMTLISYLLVYHPFL
ncbi:hypothetical protein [Rummeliibacillus sp. TYF-LIM-RU47]|uniref:hypothetical protein n=1 Tax=Rummeliibacillus sp. TYF-LIM-RU47 TaxID=2608406 RepID=UPI00123C54CC|nr:hypothetical protein [Rummeliibacillus sp. TYF-LIM-RU47]